MRHYFLKDMTKGWFIGNFEPSIHQTNDFEVAIKYYKAGDGEPAHYHKIAQEITVVISGEVEMCGKVFIAGDIIVLDPMEETSFKALKDAATLAVKIPGAVNDKYLKGLGSR